MKKASLPAKKCIQTAFLDSIPVMTGYLFLGTGFGIVLNANGYGLPWAFAMSVFIYAGSMQFLAVSLLSSGASILTSILTTFMVNARHLFYGISMVDAYRDAGVRKPYMIFALTDETYSLVSRGNLPRDVDRYDYCFLVSLFDHIYWVTGSVIGSILGSVIPFNSEGIDFALTALFVTVVVDQWLSSTDHIPALIGIFATLACLLFFGSETFLIPSMLLITALLLADRKRTEAKSA